MTTSLDLLQQSYDAILQANTDAGNRVFKPGDWPTQDGQYPIIKMRLVHEDRQSIGRSGAFEFTTVATIRIAAEVSGLASVDDIGATGVETQLWALKRQIEVALVNSYPLTRLIQNIPTMTSQLAFNSDAATHIAGVQIDFSLEFYEGPENFAPVESVDLTQVTIVNPNLPPTGLSVDLPT